MQNPEIAEKAFKNAFQYKTYTSSSGQTFKYQGYENHALDELINEQKISEADIINGTNKVPTISYTDMNGNKHKHFVDIFLPKQNKCIEVKSTFLFGMHKENILNKQKAGKALGYEYEIWIYDAQKINKTKYKLDDIDVPIEKKGKMHKITIT